MTRGELVAYSGNRGGSGGPHLHLELRDGAQRPFNLFAHQVIPVRDTIAPRPVTLYWMEIDSVQGVPVHRVGAQQPLLSQGQGRYTLTKPLTATKSGYLAVEINERKNGTDNPMGVYRLRGSVDQTPYFEMTIDRIPFDLDRYSNTVLLYSQGRTKRNGVYRLYVSPNNPLPIYKGVVDRGVIAQAGAVELILEDECGNASTLRFTLAFAAGERGASTATPTISESARLNGRPVRWNEDFQMREAGLHLEIPAGSLYESILLETTTRPIPSYGYSPLYHIHHTDEALQSHITIALDATTLPEALRNKALLGVVSPKGERSAAGGRWKAGEGEGQVVGRVRSFGTYYIAVDTIAPRITPSFKEGTDLTSRKSISLVISDEFSGINTISATIDNQWALFEYDPKSRRITHLFDEKRWPTRGKHTLRLTVRDTKGNQTTYTGNYIR